MSEKTFKINLHELQVNDVIVDHYNRKHLIVRLTRKYGNKRYNSKIIEIETIELKRK